jgi:hypothetical protein
MMHMRPLFCLLVGLALLPAKARAQEFQVQEKASLAAVPLAELKPKTIVFADQPGANKDEVFITYEEWAKAKPLQQQLLSLYPGYSEPNLEIIVDGTKHRYSEKLHMYVAQARFIVAKPQGSINLARLASLPFAEQPATPLVRGPAVGGLPALDLQARGTAAGRHRARQQDPRGRAADL